MIFDKEDFREWLASFEGDERPFDRFCPIATWQRDTGKGEFHLIVALAYPWMSKFVMRIDELGRPFDNGVVSDWSEITAKQALRVLDDVDVAS